LGASVRNTRSETEPSPRATSARRLGPGRARPGRVAARGRSPRRQVPAIRRAATVRTGDGHRSGPMERVVSYLDQDWVHVPLRLSTTLETAEDTRPAVAPQRGSNQQLARSTVGRAAPTGLSGAISIDRGATRRPGGRGRCVREHHPDVDAQRRCCSRPRKRSTRRCGGPDRSCQSRGARAGPTRRGYPGRCWRFRGCSPCTSGSSTPPRGR
jgi:hypothetical protein